MIAADEFRRVLGWLAGGVTVVTSLDGNDRPVGLTATAVCSVSLEPPLVLACVSGQSVTHEAIAASGRYALNFLPAGARPVADRFATALAGKFDGIAWTRGRRGCPLLDEAMAACECLVTESIEAGDHTIFVGRVEATRVRAEADVEPPALVHYRGTYASTSPMEDAG